VVDSGSCGASFYSEGQLTANGETFDPSELTAAHKTLPFDTKVRVTNPANGRSVTVRINDRGPFIEGRCLDLSRAAFAEIASLDAGHVEVRYEVLG
jgi:rare lipoprotein A